MSEIVENNKYSNGKIYFLMNDITHEIFYVGSTSRCLKERLRNHKHSSFNINAGDFYSKRSNYIR